MIPLAKSLPTEVRRRLAAQIQSAVSKAIGAFPKAKGDEDTVTGTLVGFIDDLSKGDLAVNGDHFNWSTSLAKLRGRGPGAPEKRYGADAVLEVILQRGTRVISRKALLIQAKKDWSNRDIRLEEQCTQMERFSGQSGSIVIAYETGAFSAAITRDVLAAHGSRSLMLPTQLHPLGDYLGTEFLECRVGSMDISYDPDGELLINSLTGEIIKAPPFAATTTIHKT